LRRKLREGQGDDADEVTIQLPDGPRQFCYRRWWRQRKRSDKSARNTRTVLSVEFRQHLNHDRLQLGKMNRRDFPELFIVKALIFVP
jgi:hypothetical protein